MILTIVLNSDCVYKKITKQLVLSMQFLLAVSNQLFIHMSGVSTPIFKQFSHDRNSHFK